VSASSITSRALAVEIAEPLERLLPGVVREPAVGDRLGEARRAEVGRLLDQDQPLPQRRRHQRPADAQAGAEHLGQAPEVDDVLGVQGPQGVGGSLSNPASRTGCPRGPGPRAAGRAPGPARRRTRGQGHPGRVVEVGDRVEELDPPSVTLETFEGCRQGVGVEAVVVHRHVADLDLVLRERGQGAHVRGPLGHDHVARVAEHARDEVQGLLRALGHDHVAAGSPDPLVPHQVGEDLTAAAGPPGRRRTGGRPAPRRPPPPEHVPDDVEGQRGRERHAAGQLTTSGREATAKRARISEAVIERVPRA
jgi:hypothetical protein